MNNPPAFPLTSHWHNELNHYNGMTLRDYMAAKAMQGLLSSDVNAPLETFAKQSYKVADAMMKARTE
jgi:hypothetical protein